ncbi:MAG: hypothetical protein JWO38_901 [Gemmataceae bacterium]|nr:hypothetical protein [Gemmataceae bacterium]
MAGMPRKPVIAVLVVLVGAAGGAVWWYTTRPPATDPPPVPAGVADPAVRTALIEAREGVVKAPRSGEAWGEYGLVCRAHGLNPESNACFAEAARLDPQNPRWPYLIGLLNLRAAPADAVPHLRAAYGLAVAPPEYRSAARLRLAEALQERGHTDEAAALFAEELRENPGDARAQFGLGAIPAGGGDPRTAVGRLEGAAASPSARRKAAALLAAAYRQLEDPAAAARWEAAAASAPADLPWADPFVAEYQRREVGWLNKERQADEFVAQGRPRNALPILEDMARAYPDEHTFFKLGMTLAKAGDFPRAEQVLRSVVAQNPNHGLGHYFLGVALYQQGESLRKQGNRDQSGGMYEEAVREFRRSTELRPDHALGYLFAGLALRTLGRLSEAESECRNAVRVGPQEANTHLALGEVLMDEGRPADAVPHLEEAARLAPAKNTRAGALLEKARNAAEKK